MPWAASRHCPFGHPPFKGDRCPRCASRRSAANDAKRPSARARGYDSKWSKESRAFLALPGNSYCACGCGRIADMVDHVIAPKGNQRLFWDRSNWQPMNQDCNRRKAIKHEGAFGISPEARERARPSGLKPSRIPLTIVCGPSGGGKSRYVQSHAGPLDLVIDLDAIKAKLSGQLLYAAGPEWTGPALNERNRLLRSLADIDGPPHAWFIVSAPELEERDWWASQLGASSIIIVAPPLDVCLAQLQRDHRRAGRVQKFMTIAKEWFTRFQPGGASEVLASPERTPPPILRAIPSEMGVSP